MKNLTFLSFMRKSIGVSSRIAGGVVSLKIPLEGFHLMQVNYIKRRTMSPPQSKILNQPKGRWKRGRSPCASPSTEKKKRFILKLMRIFISKEMRSIQLSVGINVSIFASFRSILTTEIIIAEWTFSVLRKWDRSSMASKSLEWI